MEGLLSGTPLPTLLLDLARRGFSGRLLLRRGAMEKRVEMRRGWPALVESSRASESLAHVLRETGRISADAASALARHAGQPGRRELQSARELGLLPPRALLEGVAEHARLCLLEAFAWSEAEFRTEPAPEPAPDGPASGVDPLPLVQEGLETHWDLERLLAAFADHAGQCLRRGPGAANAETRLRRDEAVDRLLEPAEGTPLAQALRSATPRALAAAWVLLAFGAWRLEAPDAAPVGSAPPGPPPLELEVRVRGAEPEASAPAAPCPTEAPPEDAADARAAALRGEVEGLYARLADLDHYGVLGLPRNAGPADVRRAYVKAAKRFHPDAVARLGLDDLKTRANEVFTRVARAHAVLSNPAERRAYDERAGDDEEGQANRLAQAEMLYRKASVLLRAGRFREAAELLEPCVALWPDEPAYRIDLAWALFKQPRPRVAQAREQLEQAIARDGRSALAQQRLSLVLAELGDAEGAARARAAARRLDPSLA